MDNQNTDDVVRREACEKVKQIVKAIKAIKIKYYANFSRISEKDKEAYELLYKNLEKISDTHNLNNLKVALMQDVSQKYDIKDENNFGSGKQIDPDEVLKACYGVIDAEQDAVSRGKLKQAKRCQAIFKKYIVQINKLGTTDLIPMITVYKREKFFELAQTREYLENLLQKWSDDMKWCYDEKSSMLRDTAKNVLEIKESDKRQELEIIT